MSMYSDDSALKRLTRDECLHLMTSVPVGRIIYTRQALPAVELVNFAIYDGDIIIKTEREHFIRISPGILNGRRLSAHRPEPNSLMVPECVSADSF